MNRQSIPRTLLITLLLASGAVTARPAAAPLPTDAGVVGVGIPAAVALLDAMAHEARVSLEQHTRADAGQTLDHRLRTRFFFSAIDYATRAFITGTARTEAGAGQRLRLGAR